MELATLTLVLTRAALFANQKISIGQLDETVAQIQSQQLAEVEIAAARQSFKDALTSTEPKRELALAIGHLQSAFQALKKMEAKKNPIKKVFHYWYHGRSDLSQEMKQIEQTVAVLALITTLYLYLGDQPLANKYGEEYKRVFDIYYILQQHSSPESLPQLNKAELAAAQLMEQAGVEYEPSQFPPRNQS